MNVELLTRVCGDCMLVSLVGELDTTDAVSAAAAVTAVTADGKQLIVNLEALEYIDCHAVSALLGVRQTARQAGGDVLLAAPQGLVLRLLTLIRVAGVHESVAAAAEYMPAPAPGQLPASHM